MNAENELFLTSEQVCSKLQISKTTLHKLRDEGFPFVKLGKNIVRYKMSDIVHYLNERGQKTVAKV